MLPSVFRRPSAWALAALLLAGCSPSSPTEPIVVGHLAPLSGPDKLAGEHARQGIMLAVEEVNNSDGKINGRRVEVHHADDRATASVAADEAVRLLAVTRAVALLGGTSTDRAESIARAAQSYGVPFVTPSPLPAPPASENAFSTCVPPAQQGEVLARFAAQELKVKHVAVLVDAGNGLCAGVAAAFTKKFTAEGDRRADQLRYDTDNLADLPKRVRGAKPDAVLIAGSVADFPKLREGLTGAGVSGPVLFGGEESAWPALFADPDAGRDVCAVTTFAADGLSATGQKFVERYRERFQEAPDLYAASAYDGARLLFAALRQARPSEPQEFVKALPGVADFESVTGPLTIDKEDHGARRPVFVVRRQDGQPKVVGRYDANLP